jgi:hypothetical protein
MRTYRAHFVNHADEIFGVNHFEAEHDDAAIKHASDMFPSRIGKGYEIWQSARLVHTKEY